jgi:phosphoribosyl 1,2-cyclic phosphodiesterase
MKLKFWGCRGSITSPGYNTLRYGGNTTCLEIRPREGEVIIIDAGSGIRLLGKQLLKEAEINEIHLILTHAHFDHLAGFPFFNPAYFPRYKINVCGGPNAKDSLKRYLSHQMAAPFFPVDFSLMKASFYFANECPEMGSIGLVDIIPIPLSHTNGGYGYKFCKKDKTFVFLTDNEPSYPHPGGLNKNQYIELCKGTDLLIHDAQYTDEEYKTTKGWGHSTFFDATQIAIEAGVKNFGLFHHDPDRTDDDLDRQLEICRKQIENSGVSVNCFAATEGQEINL